MNDEKDIPASGEKQPEAAASPDTVISSAAEQSVPEQNTSPSAPPQPEKAQQETPPAENSGQSPQPEQNNTQPQDESQKSEAQELSDKLIRMTPGEAGLAADETAATPSQAEESGPVSTEAVKPRKKPDFNNGYAYYLRVAGTLMAICACVALLLAVVNGVTADKIAENERKVADDAIAALFTGFDTTDELTGEFASPVTGITEVESGGTVVGYCVFASPKGFGGAISLAVGVDTSGKATGVKILSMSETPGLGSRTKDDSFLSQFTGQSANMTLGNEIDAIAGATISSKAVFSGIKAALEAVAALPDTAAADTSAVDTTSVDTTAADTTAADTTAADTTATDTTTDTTAVDTAAETAASEAAAATEAEGGGV